MLGHESLAQFFLGEGLEPLRYLPYMSIGVALSTALDRKGTKPRGPWITCLGGFAGGLLMMEWGLSRGLAVGAVRGLSLAGATFGAVLLWQVYEWIGSGALWSLALGWIKSKARDIGKNGGGHDSGEIKRSRAAEGTGDDS